MHALHVLYTGRYAMKALYLLHAEGDERVTVAARGGR